VGSGIKNGIQAILLMPYGIRMFAAGIGFVILCRLLFFLEIPGQSVLK
jgi:hypothetical protein